MPDQDNAQSIDGRFYVLKEREYTVRDHRGQVIYRFARKTDAVKACNRLNEADSK